MEDGIGTAPAPPGSEAQPARLEVRGVTKTFPGVRALSDVDFLVRPGEVHALIGENGAGKSTLMHVIAGVHRLDAGEIRLDGSPYAPIDERAAQVAGVAMVYQERSLTPELSVAENIFAGRQPTNRFGLILDREMTRRTKSLLEDLESTISPAARVGVIVAGPAADGRDRQGALARPAPPDP